MVIDTAYMITNVICIYLFKIATTLMKIGNLKLFRRNMMSDVHPFQNFYAFDL